MEMIKFEKCGHMIPMEIGMELMVKIQHDEPEYLYKCKECNQFSTIVVLDFSKMNASVQ